VIHLVPSNTIGGVEIMAQSIGSKPFHKINYAVEFISHKTNRNNLLYIIKSAWGLAKVNSPDLLITSLWRSLIVGILVKILNNKIKLVVFLHSTKNFHWFEAIVTRVSFRFATEIWADSRTTILARVKGRNYQDKSIPISVKLKHIKPLPNKSVTPTFVFWGRLSSEKNIGLSIKLFNNIYKNDNVAQFTIIGPDGGDELKIKKMCNDLGLNNAVHFEGAADFNRIKEIASRSSFYLQTSLFEGASMSVMEAMQLGLVPIVTPVGDISRYCKNKYNSLVIIDNQGTFSDINLLLNDNNNFQNIRERAINTFTNRSLYVDDIHEACMRLLKAK